VKEKLEMDTSKLFEDKADLYAAARPLYPKELFEFIASQANAFEEAWDCGAGNGQAALGLSEYFNKIEASDISEGQISNAFKNPKTHYSIQAAEETNFKENQFDLVNVAMALHWFDLERFWPEVNRVLKPKGLFVAYCYSWSTVDQAIDKQVETAILKIIEPYWSEKVKSCWDGYKSLDCPFERIECPQINLKNHLDLDQFLNYMHTWSATRACMREIGDDFFKEAKKSIAQHWGEPGKKRLILTPLNILAGKNWS